MANGKGQRLEGSAVSAPRFPFFIFLSTTSLAAAEGGESRKKRDAAVIGRHQLRLQRSRGCRSKAEEASFEVSCIVVQGVTR